MHSSLSSYRALIVSGVTAVATLLSAAPSAEASFARKLSGKLSRNKSTATQQLTADPPSTLDGTVAVSYNPALVSLYYPPDPLSLNSARFIESPGFVSQEIRIAVDDGAGGVQYVTPGQFLDSGAARIELGEIRVTFSRIDVPLSTTIVIPPGPGYSDYVTEPGFQQGDDLFAAIFYERANYEGSIVFPDNPPVVSPFNVYVPEGSSMRIVETEGGDPITLGPGDVTPGTISIPEPGSLALLAVAGLAMSVRRRRAM